MPRLIRDFFGPFRGFESDAKKMVVASILASIGDTFIWFLLLLYLDALGYAKTELGIATFLWSMFATLPLIPSGYLSDRIGRKKMIFIGIFVSATGMALLFRANTLIGFYIGSSIWGLSHSLYQPAFLGFLSEKVTEERRKFLFTFYMSTHQLAAAFTILAAGFMPSWLSRQLGITVVDGFRVVFLIAMVFILMQIFPLLLTDKEKKKLTYKDKEPKQDTKGDKQKSFPRTTLFKLCIPMALFGLGAGLIVPFFQVYFKWRFGTSLEDIGILFFLTSFIWAIIYLPMPHLAERGGSVKAITIVHSAAIVALLAIPTSPSFLLVAIAYMIRMVLMNSTWPLFQSYSLSQMPREHRSLTISTTSFSFNSMKALTPLAAGYIYGFNLELPFLICASFYIAATILFYLFFRRRDDIING
ncbi:MAG: MFS transporter [Thermoplasmata archaeon]|nr:MAG: MFS transporter [Thermoplasmata archaeon]